MPLSESEEQKGVERAFSMVAMNPSMIMQEGVQDHVRERVSAYVKAITQSGSASSAGSAISRLGAIAEECGLPATRLALADENSLEDRVAQIIQACVAAEFSAGRER